MRPTRSDIFKTATGAAIAAPLGTTIDQPGAVAPEASTPGEPEVFSGHLSLSTHPEGVVLSAAIDLVIVPNVVGTLTVRRWNETIDGFRSSHEVVLPSETAAALLEAIRS